MVTKLSELLARTKPRASWSSINMKLKRLQPGEVVSLRCPLNTKLPAFRSTILTNGKRFFHDDWRLSTRTEGRTVHCFLVARNGDVDV